MTTIDQPRYRSLARSTRRSLAPGDTREATVVFETGPPGNVTRQGTTVRSLCEEHTPPWKRRALQRTAIVERAHILKAFTHTGSTTCTWLHSCIGQFRHLHRKLGRRGCRERVRLPRAPSQQAIESLAQYLRARMTVDFSTSSIYKRYRHTPRTALQIAHIL
jgi:hypothetical protein